jgi:antitoxin ParD1/3/4
MQELTRIARAGYPQDREEDHMGTMNISLPESLKAFVEAQITEGGYGSASQYVCALIRADQQRQAEERLEALLLEGLNSGEPSAMTAADWQEIRRQVEERLGQHKTG